MFKKIKKWIKKNKSELFVLAILSLFGLGPIILGLLLDP